MLGFREKLNKDAELVELIRTQFVAVAVDHEVERRNDAEGELYRQVAGKAVSNSVFAFDPSGRVLYQRLGDEIYQKFAPPLAAAIRDYQPAQAAAESSAKNLNRADEHDEHYYPVPDGAVVVHVTSRVVGGDQGWPGSKVWGRDNMWIRPEEVAALAQGQLPDSLQQRLVLCHLTNTTGVHLHASNTWRPQHVEKMHLQLSGGRLSGTVELRQAPDRYYRAKLLGYVEIQDGKLTRFDVVALGDARAAKAPHGWAGLPEGNGKPYALAIALRLLTDDDGDALGRTPPAAVHHGGRAAYEAYTR